MADSKDTNESAHSDAELGVDECPVCGRVWPHPSEQGRCVELFGECVVCRFVPAGQPPNKYGSGAGTDAKTAIGEIWPFSSGRRCSGVFVAQRRRGK